MTALTIMDFSTGERREATQADIDWLQDFALTVQIQPWPEASKVPHDFDFRLAVYPNRMRDDGVFVGEDKVVEPYEGVSGLGGEKIYPSMPRTEYAIGRQLPYQFAHELVRRWNLQSPKGV